MLAAHHGAQYGVGLGSQWETPPPWDNQRSIGFTFQVRWGRGNERSRGVRGGQRQGRVSVYSSYTGTCGTP